MRLKIYRNIILLLISLFVQFATSVGVSEAQDIIISVQLFDYLSGQRPRNVAGIIGKRYVWNFQQTTYTVLIEINVEKYNAYANKEHSDMTAMVSESTVTLAKLTQAFRDVISRNSFSNEEAANFVLAFGQALPYTVDSATTGYDEFRRYAIETLVEGGGDCEDTTILVGSILNGLGFQLALIEVPGHIAIGVSGNFTGAHYSLNGTKYFYGETTGSGWKIGQMPDEYTKVTANLMPIREGKLTSGGNGKKVIKPVVKSVRKTDNSTSHLWIAILVVGIIALIALIALVSMQPAKTGQKRASWRKRPKIRRPSRRDRRENADDILNLYKTTPKSRDRHSGEDLYGYYIDSERKN